MSGAVAERPRTEPAETGSTEAASTPPDATRHRHGARLGVYVDDVYRVQAGADGDTLTTDRAFLLFACEVGRSFDRLVVFGRTVRGDGRADYALPAGVELVELPHYEGLQRL